MSVLPAVHSGNWQNDPDLRLIALPGGPFMRAFGMTHRKTQRRTHLADTLTRMLRPAI